MNEMTPAIRGTEHWTTKEGGVKLFLWNKCSADTSQGTVLFVHGSSMAGQPTFDLQVPGRPDSSVMEWFAQRGYDTWSVDMEGYGRSDKTRDIYCDIANGADDLAAATDYMHRTRGIAAVATYGISSGALRAALFAQRHRERVSRLALDAFVWTGEGAPTLAQRRKRLPEFLASKRRPIDRAFVHSIFERDHPDTADKVVVDAFADAILALDDSIPNGTYIDMCSKLPIVDPLRIEVPVLVLRGQYDGIAAFDDLIEFFKRLPHPDKQFTVMAGISHASFQQKNYLTVYAIVRDWFARPEPVYVGPAR
jgi:pimeloyl-ACP methyl ester carboxylesterase